MSKLPTIAILGAGSWGTAMAVHLAKQAFPVLLWGRDAAHMKELEQTRTNERYLPGIAFPPSLQPCSDLNRCQQEANDLIIAIPSAGFASILEQLSPPSAIAWLTKGLNPKDNRLLSQMVFDQWGNIPAAAIAGPSFARETAQGLPTAITVASDNAAYQKHLQKLLHHENLRVYCTHDLIGVQLCGAVKNVIAVACGISDGIGFGANSRAALITRGLAEVRHLGMKMGAQLETFLGLAGVGDMVLTCTDNQSRNRRFGLLVGEGYNIIEAEKAIQQVVEGKHNAQQICDLAKQFDIEMPICEQVRQVISGEVSPKQAVMNLMQRSIRVE